MSRRPNSEMNGKAELNGKGSHSNGKGSHSWLETSRRPAPRRISLRQSSALLPLTILCIALGVAITIAVQDMKLPSTPQTSISRSEAFRRAVNRAMGAAELTQTAASRDEWRTVAMWWQESIDLMKMVPLTSPNYQVAQTKIAEYGHNLEYAQNKALSKSSARSSDSLWTIGSRRAEVLKLQGKPSKADRYDSMCKEVLHYGGSSVELNNGMVAKFEDLDKNLKVASDNAPPPPASTSYWTLGSTKEQLFKTQGTPSKVLRYDYSDKELLYYGDSTVDLANDRVTGYSNHDENLKVFIPPIFASDSTSDHWSLDSQREDIFRIQGTPTQVVLDNSVCTEELYYGNSTIQLTNGFITGYDNIDNNLRVKAK